MEETMMKKESRFIITPAAPAGALGVQRNPQTIRKTRPKVRIIHIFAPEIIKTDVANFRELVQRLTGKPKEKNHSKKKKPTRIIPSRNVGCETTTAAAARMFPQKGMKMEGIRRGLLHERIKEGEEETRRGVNSSGGGFLCGFGEIEGFMDHFSHEFPLFPLATAITQMDAYAASQPA